MSLSLSLMLRPTVSRPVCLGIKHPSGACDQIFYFRTEYIWQLRYWLLSDERTGLPFVCAAGPCQRSLSRVLVPWDLRPYLTVSDSRLPFSSPLTTRRVTVEVFDPASTRVRMNWTNSFITSGRTEYKSQCLTVPLLSCFSVFNRCSGNVLTEPLPSNGLPRLFVAAGRCAWRAVV
jgi:hypothetical protein